MDEELLTTAELCKWLKVTRSTIWKWRKEGLPYIGERKSLRYPKQEVIDWLKSKKK